MIKCNLRSVEVNIILENSQISLHGIVCLFVVVVVFYLHNFIQHFGKKAGSRIYFVPIFGINYSLMYIVAS